ncbi:MAG TPA: translation elongation factor Ts [Chitinispirillaceae bacterium]|jgi:elongation factor Ts|nr:translation elongation factor Ts [Chitinispirillaceae bacterium]
MSISAAQVKELREKTGLGMMICKQALIDANGDMALAIENLRKQGQATAAKRAGRAVKEGKVTILSEPSCGVVFEVNSETDFVARNDDFINFVAQLGEVLLENKPADIEAAKKIASPKFDGVTIENRVTELIGKIGEKITFRRYRKIDADPQNERIFSYLHGNGKIGVLVKLSAEKPETLDSENMAVLGKDIAMQIAAANPMAVNRSSISSDIIAKEKEIYYTQAKSSGKPEKIWDKIIEGKLAKFFQEVALVEQPFIRTPDISVTDRINETEKENGTKITIKNFVRFELGVED